MKKWIDSHPLLFSAVSFLVLYGIFYVIPPIPGLNSQDGLIVREGIMALLTLSVMLAASKKGSMRLSLKGFGYAFRKTWWLLVIVSLVGLLYAIAVFYFERIEFGRLLITVLKVAVFTLCIGIFEEGLCRGLLLNGLLAKWGKSRKGLILASFTTALIFGVLHIISSPYGDWISVLNAVLKTIQTGLLGFLLAAIYIRNRNFWSVAVIHGLFDGLAMWASFYEPQALSIEYAAGGEEGTMMIMIYLFIILITLPAALIGLKALKQAQIPVLSFYQCSWKAVPVRKENRKKKHRKDS